MHILMYTFFIKMDSNKSQSCLCFYSPGVYNLPEKIKSCAWSSLQYPSEFSIIFKVVYFRQCISLGGTVWSLS